MKRPLFISIIAIFYFLAGITSVIYIKDMGYVSGSIDIISCFVMSGGLWTLKKWARVLELFICYLQLLALMVLLILFFFVTDFKQYLHMSALSLLLLFLSIAVVNVFIIKYLKKPEIREIFH